MAAGGGLWERVLAQKDRLWFPVAVAALHAADTFILVVPNDVLLVAAVAAQRHRWLLIALLQSLGCALGCLLFFVVALYDPQGLRESYPFIFETDTWQQTEQLFEEYGVGAAFVMASVLPVHPFLFVGALSGAPKGQLITSICGGRLIRNVLVCGATAWAGEGLSSKMPDQKTGEKTE